jgi:hypothetical protein
MQSPKMPPGTEIIRTYAEYGNLIDGFFRGCYQLLFIVGRPGLSVHANAKPNRKTECR